MVAHSKPPLTQHRLQRPGELLFSPNTTTVSILQLLLFHSMGQSGREQLSLRKGQLAQLLRQPLQQDVISSVSGPRGGPPESRFTLGVTEVSRALV